MQESYHSNEWNFITFSTCVQAAILLLLGSNQHRQHVKTSMKTISRTIILIYSTKC